MSPEPKSPRLTFAVTRFIQDPRQDAKPAADARVRLTWRFARKIESLRLWLAQALAPSDPWGVIRSLVLSQSPDSESAPDPRLLRLLGFVHLLSASGIHLYAVIGLWDKILRLIFRILRLEPRRALLASRILIAYPLALCWALSGFRMGLLRPWIVLTLREASFLVGFRWRKWSPLVVMLLIELIVWSLTGHSRGELTGHLLYALAVGGGLISRGNGIGAHFSLAIGSWIFSALWELWHTGATSVLTPVFSVLTIPTFSVIVYPGAVVAAMLRLAGFSAQFPLSFLALFCERLSDSLRLLTEGALAFPTIWTCTRPVFAGALLVAVLLMALRVRASLRWALLIPIALLSTLLTSIGDPPNSLEPVAQQVEQLDVGQGDSALIRDADGRVGLIDAGAVRALSDSSWIELFSERGIERVDWVLLTHLDQDHSGGLERLARLIPIDCVIASAQELDSSRGRDFSKKMLARGLRIHDESSDCIPFPILGPSASAPKQKRNSGMMAILVPLKGGGFYLSAGDAGGEDEVRIGKWASRKWVFQEREARGERRILKVSHHASLSSSAPEFLQAVGPTEAWISVGEGNTYGHPAAPILQRLHERSIPLHRTDQEGVIAFKAASIPNEYNP